MKNSTKNDVQLYTTNECSLLCGDSLELLEKMESGSVDLIFADPPYNLSSGGFTCHAGRQVCVDKGEWDKSKGFENDVLFHELWLEHCKRVLKPNGTIWISGTYHSIYITGFTLQKQDWQIINDIAWLKLNAPPNLACRQFAASHETLIWAKKNKRAKQTFNYQLMKQGNWPGDIIKKPGKQMRSVWAINTPRPDEKRYGKHPTQKSLQLLERIVLASSNEGDLILDPFCGSATTGVAALTHNRRFIGLDSNRDYLTELAIPRLKDCSSKLAI